METTVSIFGVLFVSVCVFNLVDLLFSNICTVMTLKWWSCVSVCFVGRQSLEGFFLGIYQARPKVFSFR